MYHELPNVMAVQWADDVRSQDSFSHLAVYPKGGRIKMFVRPRGGMTETAMYLTPRQARALAVLLEQVAADADL